MYVEEEEVVRVEEAVVVEYIVEGVVRYAQYKEVYLLILFEKL